MGIVSLLLVGCGNLTTETSDSLIEPTPESAEKTVQKAPSNMETSENQATTEERVINPVTEDITGMYACPVDDSTLSITAESENCYRVELILFRLTCIDDFIGKYESNVLTVSGTDSARNAITSEITFSDEQAVLTITDTTWEYLENGTQYIFSKE